MVTGVGRIKQRDNAALWGTDAEPKLRQPDDSFWKKYAAECSRVQIAIDVFIFWCGPASPLLRTTRKWLHAALMPHSTLT